jgi:predicted dehydrogenase
VEAPAGWVVTRASVGTSIEVSEVGPAEPVRENLIAFARAVRDGSPYEISSEDLINNIALLEVITRSAESGEVVAVG